MKAVVLGLLISGGILLLAGVAMGGWAYQSLLVPLSGSASPVSFKVESGQSTATITDQLAQAGVIRSPLALRGYLRLAQQSFKAGIYTLATNGSSLQNVEPILKGAVAERQVTIPEGLRVNEVAQLLEERGVLTATDFLEAARYNPTLVALPDEYNLKADTFLEGLLFPDTYRLPADATASDIIQRMMTTYLDRTNTLSMDYETLILASIVEREAKFPDDRPLVASVFANRLAEGMPLQSDATVQYAAANGRCTTDFATCIQPEWWPPLDGSELQGVDSPYNTYREVGLPPRPITNPGLPSIRAAAQPADTDFFYFITDADGRAHFAKTLAEHNANIVRYLNQ